MVYLFTCDIVKWTQALETMTSDGGRWTVAASVYSRSGFAYTVHIGARAGAWLPLAREVIVFDWHTEVVPGSSEGKAAQRDAEQYVEQIVSHCSRSHLRFVPCLLDWNPVMPKKGGVA